MSRKLVVYFSASGNTAKLAKTLAAAADAELYEIRPAVPYERKDLNWMDKNPAVRWRCRIRLAVLLWWILTRR